MMMMMMMMMMMRMMMMMMQVMTRSPEWKPVQIPYLFISFYIYLFIYEYHCRLFSTALLEEVTLETLHSMTFTS